MERGKGAAYDTTPGYFTVSSTGHLIRNRIDIAGLQ